MLSKFFLFVFYTIIFTIHLQSQDIKECLNSDYRYILQRAYDESNNLQLVEKSNQYLYQFIKFHPNCKEFTDKEIEQNKLKMHSLSVINTNTYPFSFAFSNTMRNQKFFIEGIQIAIEDGMLEVKTILDKLIIKDGQIPILILIDIDDSTISPQEINNRREIYFAHIFKHLEGNFHYATYNRTEVNEFLEDIPINSTALEEVNLKKIYSKVMEMDVWNKLYIIRLTEKSILKDKKIFSNINSLNTIDNQSFITFDLFRVSNSGDKDQKLSTTLMTSADISGIKKDSYFDHSIPVLIIGSLLFLFIFLFSANENKIKDGNFIIINIKKKIPLFIRRKIFSLKKSIFKKKSIIPQKDGKNLLTNYFRIIFSLTIFLFLFTSYFYPYNHLFEIILGEWLEVSSNSSQAILIVVISATLISYLFLSYILSNKFIETSYLLNEIFGLPFLYGMSAYGIIFSIIYKIFVYKNIYEIFDFSNSNHFFILNLLINSCLFIISFFIIGFVVQELLKLISIRKKLIFLKDYYYKLRKKDKLINLKKKSDNYTKININLDKIKESIYKLNYLIPFSFLSLILSFLFIVFFLVKMMKSYSTDIVLICQYFYLYIPFIFSLIILIIINIKNNNLNLDYDEIAHEVRIKNIDSKEIFESFLSSNNDEYRFILNDNSSYSQLKIEKESNNLFFLNGRVKSGKKEMIKQLISKIITHLKNIPENKNKKLKILNLNFSEKLENENELSKFIEVGKLKIPEIAVLHESRKIGTILQENSKNQILTFLQEIPFIGKPLNYLISSDRFVDQKDFEISLIKDITKIYLDYINSVLLDNNSDQAILLIFENIHMCNRFSYNILMNILDAIYSNKKKKLKNNNTFVILTGDIKLNSQDPNNIDLIEYSNTFKNKLNLDFKGNRVYKFNIFHSKGFRLSTFKDIMFTNYSFAKTILNEYFIEKLYYTLKEKELVYLNDVNLTLRNFFMLKKLKFDTIINKIKVIEIIDTVNLPIEFTSVIKNDISLLTSEEKFLVMASTQLHDWFTLEQIAYTIGISEFNLEKIIFSISEKIPDLFIFREKKYLRINKKIREYFKLEIISTSSEESMGDFKMNIFAKNFINNYFPTRNENIRDLKKLSSFSFYLKNSNEILKLNSFYIREAYFNVTDRIKVFSVLKKLDGIIKDCNIESQYEFLYLVSIHYAFKKIFNNHSIFRTVNSILKKEERVTNSNGIKYLSLVVINYNFKEQLDQNKRKIFFNTEDKLEFAKEIFKKKVKKVKERLVLNFDNLLKANEREDRLIVKGWIYFLISYFTKCFIKTEDEDYKLIYENLLNLLKKHFPSIKKNIDLILNKETKDGYFYSYQPIHEFCMGEIDKIITQHKETNYDSEQKYLLTDMGILTKELEHLKVRIENTTLEIYLGDLRKIDTIKNDVDLKDKIQKRFQDSIQFSNRIKNISGLAITQSLFSHFYFYEKKFEKALKYNKESYNNNVLIKDYKGVEKSLNYRINFIKTAALEDSTNLDLKNSLEKTEEELNLLEAHNPDLWLIKPETNNS